MNAHSLRETSLSEVCKGGSIEDPRIMWKLGAQIRIVETKRTSENI